MNWIKKNDQIINLELVSEVYKHFDGKHYIKFKLSDSITSLYFKDKESRDIKFEEIQTLLKPFLLDI